MSPDDLQLVLLLAGWVVAFLLGKELATGYSQWRAQRAQRAEQAAARETSETDADRTG